jgi:hypothetical protein
MVFLVGHNSRPGPEIDLAFEVRKWPSSRFQADTRDLKRIVDDLGRNIQDARATVAGFVQKPNASDPEEVL